MAKEIHNMTVSDFENLSYSDKVFLLYNFAVYIGKRKTNNYAAVLYQLENFYIEILYSEYRKKIARFIITEKLEILNPYLEQIDVKEIITAY